MYNAMELTKEEIEAAYQALAPDERAVIDALALQLERNLQERQLIRSNFKLTAQFGPVGAREVLAKLGIWLIKKQTVQGA